jgi:hypothetical protein
MVNFQPPEFVRTTGCVWLMPTEMLPKLRVEGFSVICPLAADALEVRERIAEKRTNQRNPHEISLHLELKRFTARPHVPR